MILGILQARVSSTRLPGKVLKPLLGEPMLYRELERIQRSKFLNEIIVATSTDMTDDPIERFCVENQIRCWRGSLDNVLDRFYQVAKGFSPEHVVRLTGDCPLIDPEVIDEVIATHLRENNDYTSNTIEPTYPDGLDVEVFRFSCLETAWNEARLPSHLEHVTPFIYQQPERFILGSYKNKYDLSKLRWTVDEEADFNLVSMIYQALYPNNPAFTTQDILQYINEHPHLKTYNTQYGRNEGFQKSLLEDQLFLKNEEKKG